jgi:hypothetical protein
VLEEVPDGPPTDLEILQPLIAAHAEALTAELQAMFAARLEVMFKPLQDLLMLRLPAWWFLLTRC